VSVPAKSWGSNDVRSSDMQEIRPKLLRAWLVATALAVTACPSKSPTPVPVTTPPDATANASLGADVLVQASGRGANEDEAYAAARRALAEAVLGDAAWADLVAIDVHRRDLDPQRVTAVAGGMEVTLGLPRERVSAVVQELENGEPEAHGPAAWQEPLTTYLRAHAAAQACAQRRRLFAAQCEPSPTDEADAALAELSRGLALVSAYPDGVPVDAHGRALREPAVFVLWRGVPLAGLPLRVEADDAAALALDRVVSNAQGRAPVALANGTPMPAMRLVVDGEALLGPHRDAAPRVEIRLEPRAVGLGRWGLVVIRGAAAGASDEAAAVVQTRLRSSALGEPQALAAHDVEALRATPEDRRARKVAAIADAMSGRLDLLLLLSYDTRFASRMGGGRVWYEAEGTLEARDAWTGQVRAQAKARVEADGVGDERADAAARRKLAEALATDVLASLREAGPR
jgi:hypothetical protein